MMQPIAAAETPLLLRVDAIAVDTKINREVYINRNHADYVTVFNHLFFFLN